MNFDAFSGNRRSRRQISLDHAPAMIESLETRSLLAAAGPSIISPVGTIPGSAPTVIWESVNGAVSYDLWVSDLETRERIIFREGIVGTSTKLTAAESLHMGANRLWVRATLADSTKTKWGPAANVLLRARPVVTGPTNPLNVNIPRNIETSNWAVTWNNPTGTSLFEVFVSNQTTQTSTIYTVPNLASATDARGNVVLDGAGNPIEQEVRSLYLSGAVPVIGANTQAVSQVVNRSFVEITSDNHGLATGQRVRISGVQGNSGANGDFTVTVISENVFRLNNAVSAGTYTTGGRWVRLVSGAPAAGMTQRLVTGVVNSRALDITVANHGLKTGEQVRIAGVEGNTAANGTFYVTVLSPSVIQLRGVTGTEIYTQGGTLTKLTEFRSTLEIGDYRVFVRSTDDAGRVSAWSVAYDFKMTPAVTVRGPKGPTFEAKPTVEWNAVPGATHYQVEVYRAGAFVPLYTADFETTTSYQIPDMLTTDPVQNFEFRVRAFKLHQISKVTLSGTPVTGTYTITLTTTSKSPVTATTAQLSYDATASQVTNAIRAISGFENVTVTSQGVVPNVTFLIQIPLTGNGADTTGLGGNPVNVTVTPSVAPGTVTTARILSPRVDGQWSQTTAFSTIKSPVINGPIGIENDDPFNTTITVTDVRPTVTWTAIDKAARYEVWVERSASTSTYLRTTSPGNSYRFASNLLPGRYTVKVRAVSSTGQLTDWSNEYAFTATGGVAVINSVNVSPARQATIQWAGVAEAATYEIQIARIGVNFNYLHPTGILTTSYTTSGVLPVGSYRVWVRAVMADGTKLGWSTPVNFSVVNADAPDAQTLEDLQLVALTSSLAPQVQAAESSVADTDAAQDDAIQSDAMPHNDVAGIAEASRFPSTRFASADAQIPEMHAGVAQSEELIQKLAESCVQQEWWVATERSTS